jgi:hypothetical protein
MGIKASEYAIHRGVSKAAVSKAIKAGKISLLADGTIDPVLADKQWAGSVSRVNTPKADDNPAKTEVAVIEVEDADVTPEAIAELVIPDGLSLTEIKAIHETIKARQSYLNLVKDRGELTDLAAVNKRLFELSRELRDGWLNWVNQVAGILAAEMQIDQHKFTIALEREVNAHLTEVAKSDLKIVL